VTTVNRSDERTLRVARGPQVLAARPRAGVVGPIYEVLASGDRWLDTPGPFNGGAAGDGDGSGFFIKQEDWCGLTWDSGQVPEWPAFGGGYFDSDYWSYNANVFYNHLGPASAVLCGWYNFEAVMAAPYIGFAEFLEDPDLSVPIGLYVEFGTWIGGYTYNSIGLFGDSDVAVAENLSRILPSTTVTASDHIATFAIPGSTPTFVVAWSDLGTLYAATASLTQTGATSSGVPSLRTSLSDPISLGVFDYDTRRAGIAWIPTDDGAILGWTGNGGIDLAHITVTDTLPEVNETASISGAFTGVDLGWTTDREQVCVIASGASGATIVLLDTQLNSTLVHPVSGVSSLVVGTTVAGRPAIQFISGGQWTVRIYNETLTASEEFDVGAFRTETDSALLGWADGRLVSHVSDRSEEYPTAGQGPFVYASAPLELYTYSPGSLTTRDRILPPTEGLTPKRGRLCALSDHWFSFRIQYPSVPNATDLYVISATAMPPNMWFVHVHHLHDRLFAVVNTATDFDAWGPYVDLAGSLVFCDNPSRVILFEMDELGEVTNVGSWRTVAEHSGTAGDNIQACSNGTQIYVVADKDLVPESATGDQYVVVQTYSVSGMDLVLIAEEVIYPTSSPSTGAAPLGQVLYMGADGSGNDVLMWPTYNGGVTDVYQGWVAAKFNPSTGGLLDIAAVAHDTFGPDFFPFAAPFNAIHMLGLARVEETNIFVATFQDDNTGYGVATFEVDLETLAITLVDRTIGWTAASQDPDADWLGTQDLNSSGAVIQFSPDGRNIAIPVPIEQIAPPFSVVESGSYPWAFDVDGADMIAWVDISSTGSISVDYQLIETSWGGTNRVFFRSNSGTLNDRILRNMLGVTHSSQQVTYIFLAHAEVVANDEVFIDTYDLTHWYMMTIERGAAGANSTLDAVLPHAPQDIKVHAGVTPVPGTASSIIYWDIEPAPTARCDPSSLDSDATSIHVQLIGAGSARGTASVIDSRIDVARTSTRAITI
jgi:hypothetical protein